jgi:hypothetical protein
MRSPTYTPLDLNNIVHKYFREREKKKKDGKQLVSTAFRPKVFRNGKKEETLRLYVCAYIRLFLFSLVVRDAPATGNIPIVSFPP